MPQDRKEKQCFNTSVDNYFKGVLPVMYINYLRVDLFYKCPCDDN